jgi:WD40 repeat protein
MAARHLAVGWFLLLFVVPPTPARAPFVPPGDPDPILQVEAGGPRSRINALAFGDTGETLNLYEAGFDKVVRVWTYDNGAFRLARTYRIPIGPESEGLINAMAVSADGRWLAVGGRSVRRDSLKFGAGGFVIPDVALKPELLLDEGTIYVFDTERGTFRGTLRGHRGPVVGLAFVRGKRGKPVLVSAGRELLEDKLIKNRRQTALRAWDLDKPDEPIKQTLIDSDVWVDATSIPPGLAVYRRQDAGANPVAGLRVALAFRNGKLYHWNAETGGLTSASDDRLYTETAVFGDDGALYTGGVIPRGEQVGGKVDRWRIDEDGKLTHDRRIHVAGRHLPQALAFLRGEKDSAGKIAVVLQPSSVETHYRLAVVSLDTERVEKTIDLWSGEQATRQVAVASRDGRFLAIADNVTPALRTWKTETWEEASRPLRGVGDMMGKVAFVRRGDHRGLRLWARGEDAAEQVFDVDDKRLLDGARGWKADTPDAEAWDVKADAKNQHFVISHDGEVVGRVHLGANQKATAWSLLPGRGAKPALLAVGYEERGIAYLALYTAGKFKTVPAGQLVRLLVGHQGAIRSLAFDADGQALASAGEDQTVSVWSLKDLLGHLAIHGGLRGFRCMEKDRTVVSLPPENDLLSDANREALKDLESGTEIEEMASGARKKAPKTLQDFGNVVWNTRPGATVTMRVGGRAVELTADQGVDLRMPLFSLFFLQGAAAGQEWVGWSPSGSFDVGNRKGTEKYLAWHLNTGKADKPADAVSLDKERKEYYRPDILRFLLKSGDHDTAVDEWKNAAPKDPPQMTIAPTGPDVDRKQTDREDRLLLRKPPTGLEATLSGDFPLNRIGRVAWQLDDEAPVPFAGKSATDLRADFGRRTWKRGIHTLQLLVQLDNSARTTYRSDAVSFRYALPQPLAELSAPVTTTEKEALAVRYEFGPGPGGDEARPKGKLRHTWWVDGKQQEEVHALAAATGTNDIKLRMGRNLLQLEVVNDAPSEDSYPSGTAIKQIPITRIPGPNVVTIALTGIRTRDQELKFPADGKELIVSTPFVIISGKAEGKDGLQDVSLDGETPRKFKAGVERFTFEKKLDLRDSRGKPRTVRFSAKTERRTADEPATLTLTYLPALPEFRVTSPQKVDASRSSAHVLVGAFDPPEDVQPFTFKLVVNGVEVKRIDKAESLAQIALPLEVEVKVKGGDNTVAVELENQWQHPGLKKLTPIYYRRPPEVVKIEAPDKLKTPFVDVRALVRSASGLPVTAALVKVLFKSGKDEDHPVSADDIAYDKDEDRWVLNAAKVPFGKGAERIAVYAANGDGQSLDPGVKDISFTEPLPDRPTITIQRPARERLQTRPPYELAFTVTPADVPLEDLRVRVNGTEVADLRTLKRQGEGDNGSYVTEVPFKKGVNTVEIVARNAGGESSLPKKEFQVEPPPVSLDTDSFRLEQYLAGGKRQEVPRLRMEQGIPTFEEAAAGLVVFSGAFLWEAGSPDLKNDEQVRVSVNGHEQFGGRLSEPIDGRRRFELALRLNRKEANEVEVTFPAGLKIDPLKFSLKCTTPVLDQRLLLLVLAPGYADQKGLREKVAKAFHATKVNDDGSFETPAFREGLVLGPDRPNFNFGTVNNYLYELDQLANQSAEKFRKPTPEKAYNDVIVVYFRGEDRVTRTNQYLLTEEALQAEKTRGAEAMKRAAVDCNFLRERLASVKGAKILLVHIRGRQYSDGAEKVDPPSSFRAAASEVGMLEWGWLSEKKISPEEDLLLRMWRRSLSQTELFWQVRQKVRGATLEESLTYHEHVPPVLDAMVLNRKGLPRP